MKSLIIGGVPEHFNLPWHLAIDNQLFTNANIEVIWRDYPGGTGAMTKDLREGKLDMAVLLTEGIIADIAKGNPSKLLQPYVQSPLTWGIFVPASSPYQQMSDVKDKTYAISRFGSGSHLMAYVDVSQRGWNPEKDLTFKVVGGMEGARKAFKENTADVFMWEKFMTKPLVDSGEFRMIAECVTPWPCFSIAATQTTLQSQATDIQKVLNIILQQGQLFKQRSNAIALISERYNLQKNDIQAWLDTTEWASTSKFSSVMLHKVMDTLLELQIISKKIPISKLCHQWDCNNKVVGQLR